MNAILGLILLGPAAGAAVGAYYARKHGYQQGYRRAYAEQEILVDDLQAENRDLEQRNAELSRQQGRAAA
jgi:hypothetical protein